MQRRGIKVLILNVRNEVTRKPGLCSTSQKVTPFYSKPKPKSFIGVARHPARSFGWGINECLEPEMSIT